MNGVHNHNLDKPIPGCLGRMVNLFDFSVGMSGNRLLTDRPHYDGSSQARRSLSDVSRSNQLGDITEHKIVSDSGRNCTKRKPNGTPMKTLIAHEMSKELASRSNPPGLLAKLMGLDALPHGQPDLAAQRSRSRGHSRSNSDLPLSYWHQDKEYWDLEMGRELNQRPHPNEYKDVYEVTKQPQKPNGTKDKSPRKARPDEHSNDEKMALVREKFVEAKRLSTDERLRQSPEFDDALEVLNSNKDLFIKFLQEPCSIFSEHAQQLHSVSSLPETKRITVLKPCKMFNEPQVSGLAKKAERQIKKAALVKEAIGPQRNHLGLSPPSVGGKPRDDSIQPTRIVVLKPSCGKPHDTKAVVSPHALSPGVFHSTEIVEEIEDADVQKTRECAQEITRQICENLSGKRKDKALLSSVFLNGYIGDESSFHKSENDYAPGTLSDAEITSPASRHSWDYVNRFGSPHSTSFSRASYSPESSVCREAKKRLSERWATMAFSQNHQEQRHLRRGSSTLGEMLALSDIKNTTILVDKDNAEDSTEPTLSITSSSIKDIDTSPRNLVRSKSVPVLSTIFGGNVNLINEGSKTDISETSKGRNVKSSLKGKVSSLFFSRSRKSNTGKSAASESKDESQPPGSPCEPCERDYNGRTQYLNYLGYKKECSSAGASGPLCKVTSPEPSGKPCIIPAKVGFDGTNPMTYGNASESQDQPSPVSVLELLFDEDEHTTIESYGNNDQENGALFVPHKCNLIEKSPPIGSIARTLSLDDSCVTTTSCASQKSLSHQVAEEERKELFSLVEKLLSLAGLDGGMESDVFMGKWHSSESPLDPSLRDKHINPNDGEAQLGANRRQRISTHKLVFDCVNAALVDIAGYGSETCRRAVPCLRPHKNISEGGSLTVVNQVWSRMTEWFPGEERWVADEFGDSNILVVEQAVMKEVVGKGWTDYLRLEMDNIGLRIERQLLENLLQETLVEFTIKT